LSFDRPQNDLSPAQARRLKQFGAAESVEMHCHCLPGLDDGPASLDESLSLCRAMVDDGITVAIATPHQMGRYDRTNTPSQVRSAVDSLNAALQTEKIPLRVEPGADVRVDERTMGLLAADRILTLADRGSHLLLELPHETLIDLRELLVLLLSRQITPIISHPERHPILRQRLEILRCWSRLGAAIQITCGSLLGQFDSKAKASAWQLLDAGLVDLIASDAHDTTRRPPSMTAAIGAITRRIDFSVARRLCVDNPLAILTGSSLTTLRRSVRSEVPA
jgi:protein-tyrosine phosphatase